MPPFVMSEGGCGRDMRETTPAVFADWKMRRHSLVETPVSGVHRVIECGV